jgi:hypothetical protein
MTAPHIHFQTTRDSILSAVAELRKREAIAPMFLPELDEIETDLYDLLEAIEENEKGDPDAE